MTPLLRYKGRVSLRAPLFNPPLKILGILFAFVATHYKASFAHEISHNSANPCALILTKVAVNRFAPAHLKEVGLALEKPSSLLIDAAKRGETISYVVDGYDRVYFVRGIINTTNKVHLVINNTSLNRSDDMAFIPKAIGQVVIVQNEAKLVPTQETFPLAKDEIEAINNNLHGLAKQTDPEHPEATQLIKCNKVLAAGKNGNWFITNKLISAAAVQTAVLGTMDHNRFTNSLHDSSTRRRLINDYATTASNVVLKSTVGKYAVLNNFNYFLGLGARFGTGWTSVRIQGLITHAIVREDGVSNQESKEYRKAITDFNDYWLYVNLVKSDAIDRVILKKIPAITHSLCLTNPKLSLVINPHSVRYMEDGFFTAVYYGVRKKYFQHQGIHE